jgi:hypothetical protein
MINTDLEPTVQPHDHSAAYYETSIENQTPEFILRLRNHMREAHGAGSGWCYGVSVDLLAESHNFNHGRDAFGGVFRHAMCFVQGCTNPAVINAACHEHEMTGRV